MGKILRVNIIDGNNQFFINMSRALNSADLARRCFELHRGFDLVYWVFDGLDSRKHRRDLDPKYKDTVSREKNRNDLGRYELLKNFKKKQLPEHGGIIVVEIPFFEADDIIRKLALHHSGLGAQVVISSNDADLFELTQHAGVVQPQSKLPKNCTSPALIPMYKTLVGDASDNIKGLKGFGEAAWEKLSENDLNTITRAVKNNQPILAETPFDDLKLKDKIIAHWDAVLLSYKLVDYIEVSDDSLVKHLKIYPKKVLQSGTNLCTKPTSNLTMG